MVLKTYKTDYWRHKYLKGMEIDAVEHQIHTHKHMQAAKEEMFHGAREKE